MKTTAFICEFNPLHEGHRYFIRTARETTGADCLIALMSGDFVQRGEPAILPMHERTKDALAAGADLILQLPEAFSTGSAAYFAEGGVRILDALGCVDALAFGTEPDRGTVLLSGSKPDKRTVPLSGFSDLAAFMYKHKDDLQPLIREGVRNGLTYAAARARAIIDLAGSETLPAGLSDLSEDELSQLLSRPNNQLALSYMVSLLQLGSSIEPVPIRRDPSFASSSQIRSDLLDADRSAASQPYLAADDFSLLLKDRLMMHDAGSLSGYLDITLDLARRIKKHQNEFVSWGQFTDLLHTKEMTRARISRCLTHILLGIKKDDPLLAERGVSDPVLTKLPPFVRILGFRREAQPLLAAIKDKSSVSVSTQLPLTMNDAASDLYESVRTDKYALPFTESHQYQPVIL